MKLSEAILNGCLISKKTTGIYITKKFWRVFSRRKYDACAIGAAYLGIKEKYPHGHISKNSLLNILMDTQVKHPIKRTHMSLFRTLISLNDEHELSREKIANWLIESNQDIEI